MRAVCDSARGRNVRLEDVEASLLDETEGPAALAERSEIRTGIERALATLPPLLREAFVMHYVDGIPYETMASLLGISISALKMRAQRARHALSSALRKNHVTDKPRGSSLYQVR